MEKVRQEAFEFHREWGGRWKGYNAADALELARAELVFEHAGNLGIADIDWDDDPDPSDPEIAAALKRIYEWRTWQGPYVAVLTVNGHVEASRACITFGRDDDPLTRVINAELAIEAKDALEQAVNAVRTATGKEYPFTGYTAISEVCTAVRRATETLNVPVEEAVAYAAARFGLRVERHTDWREME